MNTVVNVGFTAKPRGPATIRPAFFSDLCLPLKRGMLIPSIAAIFPDHTPPKRDEPVRPPPV